MQKMRVTDFASDRKRVENLPYFVILGHVIQHGRQGFTVKKCIEGELTEANDLSRIL